MRIEKAMLMWNPGTAEAAVIEHPDRGKGRDYLMSVGACFFGWKKLSNAERVQKLINEAWVAAVRDGVDPQALHKALCSLRAYRDAIPGDVPGSTRDPFEIMM